MAEAGRAIPSVGQVMAANADRRRHRGRLSALYTEQLRDIERETPEGSPAKMSRTESLQLARASRANKRAATKAGASQAAAGVGQTSLQAANALAADMTLPPAAMELLRTGAFRPGLPSPLATVLTHLPVVAKASPKMEELVDEFARSDVGSATSAMARALRLGLRTDLMQKSLHRLASAALEADGDAFRRLVDSAAKSGWHPLLFLEAASYDETPMRGRLDTVKHDIVMQRRVSSVSANAGRGDHIARARGTVVSKDNSVLKLFQTRATVGVVLRHQLPDQEEPTYVFLYGRPLTWVQTLESTSAAALLEALLRCSFAPNSADDFDMRVRVVSSDRLAANMKAERDLIAGRPGWLLLHSGCGVHDVATAQSKTWELLSKLVSDLVNFSLSLRCGGNMKRFRSCLESLIAGRLRIVHGSAPPRAAMYRHYCLSLFCGNGGHAAKRRALLLVWGNGDWRNEQHIEHYLDPRRPVSKNATGYVARSIANACLVALTSTPPPTFPRSRWTGWDLAVDYAALLLCVHNIGRDAYRAFVICCGGSLPQALQPRAVAEPEGGSVGAIGDIAAEIPEVEGHDEGEVLAEGVGVEQEVALSAGGVANLTQPSVAAVDGEPDWAALNKEFRKYGLRFMESRPLGHLMVLRQCLEPFRLLVRKSLRHSGEAWDTTQEAFLVKSRQEGKPPERSFRATVAACGSFEDSFYDTLQGLFFDKTKWQHLPALSSTIATQTLTFTLLSRAGCAIEEYLVRPHSRFPLRLFLLLEEPDAVDIIADAPPCLQDAFTKEFLASFGERGVGCADALACLEAVARVWRLDIADVECRHAALRRMFYNNPQTHLLESKTLSAMWLGRTISKRQINSVRKGVKQVLKRTRARAKPAQLRRRRRSAWAEYVAEASMGVRADFRELAIAYSRLPLHELKRLHEKAAHSNTYNLRRPNRGPQRGKHARQSARLAARRQREEALWGLARDDLKDASKVASVLSRMVAEGYLAEDFVASAVREASAESERRRQQERRDEELVNRFRAEHQAEIESLPVVSALKAVAPGIDFLPRASQGLVCAEFVPDVATTSARALHAAKRHFATSNLGSALEMGWSRRNAMVESQSTDADKEDGAADAEVVSWCYKFGVCVCSDEGKDLRKFCNAFLNKVLKAGCRPLTRGRELLKGAKIVLAFYPVDAAEGPGMRADDFLAPDFFEGKARVHWHHVGLQSFSLYWPILHALQVSDNEPPYPNTLPLRATCQFASFFPCMESMNRRKWWWGATFVLWECSRPLPTIDPAEVYVESMGEPVLFWTDKRRLRRRSDGLGAWCDEAGMGLIAGGDEDAARGAPIVDEEHADPVGEPADDDAAFADLDDLLAEVFGDLEPSEVDFSRVEGNAPRSLDVDETGEAADPEPAPVTPPAPEGGGSRLRRWQARAQTLRQSRLPGQRATQTLAKNPLCRRLRRRPWASTSAVLGGWRARSSMEARSPFTQTNASLTSAASKRCAGIRTSMASGAASRVPRGSRTTPLRILRKGGLWA